jgi:hypothetical protein
MFTDYSNGCSDHGRSAHAVDDRSDAELLIDVGRAARGGEIQRWPEAGQ